MAQLKDLTGMTFNRWTVLKRDLKRTDRTYWICQCSCENKTIKSIRTDNLKRGISKSCGCYNKEIHAELARTKLKEINRKDLTGQRFGRAIAIEPAENRKDKTYWKCKCDCGNLCEISTQSLLKNTESSCGCFAKDFLSNLSLKKIDEKNKIKVGQKYGLLTLLEPTDKIDNYQGRIWKCQCDCGNICQKSLGHIISGNTKSCGCLGNSYGEYAIENLLKTNNIEYEKEKFFETCRFPKTNKLCRFDFFVKKEYFIEFDGKQHFHLTGGWNTSQQFEDIQAHDNYKNQWCKENNIPLIRIPYNYINKIKLEDLLLETSKFIKEEGD